MRPGDECPREQVLAPPVGVIAGALVAELVVYLGVLLADASAGGQPAQQITCYGSDAAGSVLPGCDGARTHGMLQHQPFCYCPHHR